MFQLKFVNIVQTAYNSQNKQSGSYQKKRMTLSLQLTESKVGNIKDRYDLIILEFLDNNGNILYTRELYPNINPKKVQFNPKENIILHLSQTHKFIPEKENQIPMIERISIRGVELAEYFQKEKQYDRQRKSVTYSLQIRSLKQEYSLLFDLSFDKLRQFSGRMSLYQIPNINVKPESYQEKYRFANRIKQFEERQLQSPEQYKITTLVKGLICQSETISQYQASRVNKVGQSKAEVESNWKTFYKGPCASINFFSVLDERVQDQDTFSFVEDVYRDFDMPNGKGIKESRLYEEAEK